MKRALISLGLLVMGLFFVPRVNAEVDIASDSPLDLLQIVAPAPEPGDDCTDADRAKIKQLEKQIAALKLKLQGVEGEINLVKKEIKKLRDENARESKKYEDLIASGAPRHVIFAAKKALDELMRRNNLRIVELEKILKKLVAEAARLWEQIVNLENQLHALKKKCGMIR